MLWAWGRTQVGDGWGVNEIDDTLGVNEGLEGES